MSAPTEYLEINSVAFYAWILINHLSPLWDMPPLRGADRLIPFAPGQQPLPRIQDEARVPVPFTLFGDVDWTGTPYSTGRIGLMTNRDYLVQNVRTPNPSGNGTYPLVLHMPDGSSRGADCFVLTPIAIN